MEKKEPSYTGLKRKLVQPLWKTVWRFLKKLKIEIPYDPAISILDLYLEKMKLYFKRYMHLNVHKWVSESFSLISNYLQPHRWQPTRLLCPWNSPGQILEWFAITFCRGSSNPEFRPGSPALQADCLPSEPPRKPYQCLQQHGLQ